MYNVEKENMVQYNIYLYTYNVQHIQKYINTM